MAVKAHPIPRIEHSLLKENQVAKKLNVSVATLRRWRWEGSGPQFRKLNGTGSIRYTVDDIETYIDACLRTSTSDSGEGASS